MTHTREDTVFKINSNVCNMGIFAVTVMRTAKNDEFSHIFHVTKLAKVSALRRNIYHIDHKTLKINNKPSRGIYLAIKSNKKYCLNMKDKKKTGKAWTMVFSISQFISFSDIIPKLQLIGNSQ